MADQFLILISSSVYSNGVVNLGQILYFALMHSKQLKFHGSPEVYDVVPSGVILNTLRTLLIKLVSPIFVAALISTWYVYGTE